MAADIFGRTSALEALSAAIGNGIDIMDPYSGRRLDVADEAQAYAYFTANQGLDRYSARLLETVQSIAGRIDLIGFSVGASALWMIADRLDPASTGRMVCYYGSQIRHHLDIAPRVRVDLVMPATEPHFDVDELAGRLAGRQHVTIYRTPYRHGFMNRLSRNYDPAGCRRQVEWLRAIAGHPAAPARDPLQEPATLRGERNRHG